MNTLEEFLVAQNKVYKRKNITEIKYLVDNFPDFAEQAYNLMVDGKVGDPADREGQYSFPIIIDSRRMTEARILNTVSYLIGKLKVPMHYTKALRESVFYQEIFNYDTYRYQRAYEPVMLWQEYFLGLPELKKIIEARRISNLEELVYRAREYFEDYEKKLHK